MTEGASERGGVRAVVCVKGCVMERGRGSGSARVCQRVRETALVVLLFMATPLSSAPSRQLAASQPFAHTLNVSDCFVLPSQLPRLRATLPS